MNRLRPFDTEEEAREALEKYAKELERPKDENSWFK